MPVTQDVLDEIALTRAEYDLIVERIGREPNPVELGMFGALWSEHCGYKHSRPLLRMFRHTRQTPGVGAVLSAAGAENAGAVDIGDGLAVVFKVESHNHPSAVEPFQGAATGVGGIVRDILAMGARPIALLNSLRFGPPDDAANGPRNRHLLGGVVRGISWYGNCIGVPDVGGEIGFDPAYSHNPLVNAMCVGLIEKDRLASAAARVPGSVLLLAGADTGRDGIHGASGLASRTFDADAELRPTVQVGNPFLEKSLIEACLEAMDTGAVLAIQDLGAAGLTSAAIESAARAGRGVRIDLSRVHRREGGMTPYEVMLSESQERMLLAIPPERAGEVQAVFRRWDIECREIGRVIAEPEAQIYDGDRPMAHLPIQPLAEAPAYRLEGRPAAADLARRDAPLSDLPLPPGGPAPTLLRLLAAPNIASKQAVYRQYDHQVQTNTVAGPGAADAAVLRIKGVRKAIALAVDGNGRYCQLDPYTGGQIAVAEVCRNLACVGARPLALTDCLNFGSPRRPDIYYQLEECIRGMADASEILDAPVVSGNVSLFNETQGQAVLPTPVVGALGLLDDAAQTVGAAFPAPDLAVMLLGPGPETAAPEDLAGSEYLHLMHGMTAGRPRIDLELERRTQQACRQAIAAGLIRSAHDCSDGGLLTALAESSILGGIGFRLATPPPFPADAPSSDDSSIPANPSTFDDSPTPANPSTRDAASTPANLPARDAAASIPANSLTRAAASIPANLPTRDTASIPANPPTRAAAASIPANLPTRDVASIPANAPARAAASIPANLPILDAASIPANPPTAAATPTLDDSSTPAAAPIPAASPTPADSPIPANPPTATASPIPAASPTPAHPPTPAAHPRAPSFPRKRESSVPPGWDAVLFGEKQSRIIVSLNPGHAAPLREIAAALGVPATLLGFTGGDTFDVGGDTGYGDAIPLADLAAAWTQALEAAGD